MVRQVSLVCAALAAVALVVFSLVGRPLAGIALAVGLLLGAGNGFLAARFLRLPLPFVASSLARLVGVENIWLVLLGAGASQFVLVAFAARAVARR